MDKHEPEQKHLPVVDCDGLAYGKSLQVDFNIAFTWIETSDCLQGKGKTQSETDVCNVLKECRADIDVFNKPPKEGVRYISENEHF